jgi:hypothetical protein
VFDERLRVANELASLVGGGEGRFDIQGGFVCGAEVARKRPAI